KAKLRQMGQKSKRATGDADTSDGNQSNQSIPTSLIPRNMSKIMFGPLYTDHEYLEELLRQE
ncbi:unnamed protein product, partial [Trichobilharzia szidati]